ncbi:unnamed protein product [Effrenium voratum]|uniref:Uncharacterized protein n=1 Tax=Effrenium voratum TaxID=2562239 RepID=A0AA36J0C9_9DINO|nr:unnamed protein product [Effrenium voratum]CAJ1434313.1 unnamed protein product [Effrenium voratum]
MHDRRIADIERALIAGEECSLYPMELEHARHTLIEARKADAVYRLEKALSSREIEAIRIAIDQAEEAGVSQSKLQAAERALEAVKKQSDARLLLHEARRSGDIRQLRQAIDDASDLGLQEAELVQIRLVLDLLERKAAARESLDLAVRDASVEKLEASLAMAEAAGLKPPEMQKARKALEQEEAKAAARVALKDAKLGKKASAEGRINDLREAVQEGREAGLSQEELEPAQRVLEKLRMEVTARKQLEEAMELGSIDALRPAIAAAAAAGIDEEELFPAQKKLEDAYKPTARAKLKEAVQLRDIATLQAAIDQAKAVGLSVMAIAEASEVIKEEELKIQLRKRLSQLYGSTNMQELRAAVNLGSVNGLKDKDLADARKQISELEQQEASCESLSEAIKGREIVSLQVAIKAAKALAQQVLTNCIPPELVADAEKELKKEIEQSARDMLLDSIKRCNGAMKVIEAVAGDSNEQPALNAKAALQQRRRSQANFEAALQAIGIDSRPNSREAQTQQAGRRTSGLGKRRMSALHNGQLGGSSAAGDEYSQRIQNIQVSIRGAEALGLDETDIAPAREARPQGVRRCGGARWVLPKRKGA